VQYCPFSKKVEMGGNGKGKALRASPAGKGESRGARTTQRKRRFGTVGTAIKKGERGLAREESWTGEDPV